MPGSMGPFTMPGSVGLFVSHLGQWGYIMPGSWVTGSCCFIRRSLLLKEITQRHTNTTSLAWIRSLCHAWVSRSLCAMHGSTHLHVACLGHWVSVLCLGQWVSMCHAQVNTSDLYVACMPGSAGPSVPCLGQHLFVPCLGQQVSVLCPGQ